MKILLNIWHIIGFILFYMKRVIQSNMQLAHDILTPTFHMKPAIIEVPIHLKSDHEILALINLVTMTPGTLSMDISDDKKTFFVHVMYLYDKDEFFSGMETLEQHIHKALSWND